MPGNSLRFFIAFLMFNLIGSCKGKLYRSPSSAMEKTIMTGETFYATSTGHFERDDIVVFNFYGENYQAVDEETGKYKREWQKWVKRLIALSGDSIQLKNAEVYVNGRHIPDPPQSLSEYEVFSTVSIDDFPERDEWQTELLEKRNDTFHYVTKLTKDQAEKYRKRKPAILNVKKRVIQYNTLDTFVINPCRACQWTVDNFGPLKIPVPGDTITVDMTNVKLYQNCPGIQPGEYVIKEKLYFVLGDNRHASQDSRHIGYISHSNMYGVVK